MLTAVRSHPRCVWCGVWCVCCSVESEKTWTKNVYDIIQNYQYKYVKTVKDVREREAKIGKLAAFVKLIKQSTLHASIQNELAKASKQLSELVTRTGGSKEEMG